MMKRIYLTMLVLVAALAASAVPARKMAHILTLADGTEVSATLVGDEHGHWYLDAQGRALQVEQGIARYLGTFELENLRANRLERVQASNARRQARTEARRYSVGGPLRTFGEPTTIIGKKKGIVILVNFKDKRFLSANNNALFDDRFNKKGYTNNAGYIGSVHDYFYDQSYGKFDLSFDVIGPVTVSQNYSYYGANDAYGNDMYPATMVIEALKLADSQVNFADYDWDGDGKVDQVFCIYAGRGEASGGSDDTIWPHEFSLSDAKYSGDGTGAQKLDGVTINTYAVSCELANASTIDGIGTACHEFSHCLGYADLYDTDYSGGQGMMNWGLMDGGSYNGPNGRGEVPAPYTSYERWWAGWMELTELDSPCKIKDMQPLSSSPEAYIIRNQGHTDECYVLENHQLERWDKYTYGHGMLILHIDYDKKVWQANGPNDDPKRQRMTFMPADNSYGTKYNLGGGQYQWSATQAQKAGDTWPGTSKKTAFTNKTSPASTLYNKNLDGSAYLSRPIEDITESAKGLISFTFDGGVALGEPKTLPPTNIGEGTFTANWTQTEGAASYTLEVMAVSTSTQMYSVLSEDFSKTAGSAEGTTDIAISLDDYTQTPGWGGTKLFLTNGGLRVGSSYSGYLQTPLLPTPADGKVKVKLNVKSYGTDQSKVVVSLISTSGSIVAEAQTQDIGNGGNLEFSFTGVDSDYKVKIATSAGKLRFYLYDIDVQSTKAENYTFADLTGTSHTLTDLTSKAYKYRVQAFDARGGKSGWSDYQDVDMTLTGIEGIVSDEPTRNIPAYDLRGQRVRNNNRPGIIIRNGRKTYSK